MGQVARSIFTSHFQNEIASSAHTSRCGGGRRRPISLDAGRLLSRHRNLIERGTAAGSFLHPMDAQFRLFGPSRWQLMASLTFHKTGDWSFSQPNTHKAQPTADMSC